MVIRLRLHHRKHYFFLFSSNTEESPSEFLENTETFQSNA